MIRPALFVAWILAFVGCGQIPNGPDQATLSQSGVYTNEDWQFQISRPDETWGLNVSVSQVVRQANGLPQVQVWMSGPPASDQFQATFFMTPDALFKDDTLESFLSDLESELSAVFAGYTADKKETSPLENGGITSWVFQVPISSGRNFLPGDRFWVQAVVNGERIFVMMGNGSSQNFPLDLYRQIASSLVFLK